MSEYTTHYSRVFYMNMNGMEFSTKVFELKQKYFITCRFPILPRFMSVLSMSVTVLVKLTHIKQFQDPSSHHFDFIYY